MLRLSSTLFFIINGNGVSKFGQIETYYHQITFQDLNKTNEISQNGTSWSYNINSIQKTKVVEKNIELNSTVLQYKIYGFIRMPSKSLVGGSCQARVINNLQS